MIDNGLAAGIKGTVTAQSTDATTAIAMGSGDLPVLSTVFMAGLMEQAAYQSVAPYLPAGHHTVGTALDIRHLSATPVGLGLRAESELIAVDGNKLTFTVAVYDDAGPIGSGTHQRAVVEGTPFLERAWKKK